jgi:hypothetical protein
MPKSESDFDADPTLLPLPYGGGLNRLRDGKFSVYTTREGLPSDTVWAIYEDGSHHLCVGTNGDSANSRMDGSENWRIVTRRAQHATPARFCHSTRTIRACFGSGPCAAA